MLLQLHHTVPRLGALALRCRATAAAKEEEGERGKGPVTCALDGLCPDQERLGTGLSIDSEQGCVLERVRTA